MHRSSAIGLVVFIVGGFSGAPPLQAEQTPGYATIQRAFLQEEFPLVSTLARDFLAHYPDAAEAPRVRLWLALSLERLQRPTEALQEIETLKSRLASADSLWPELLWWEGDISRRTHKLIRAQLAYQQMLDQYHDATWTPRALLGLGVVSLEQEAFERAVGYLHEAVLRQGEGPLANEAHLFEGIGDVKLKRYQEAVGIFHALLDRALEPMLNAQAAFYLAESLTGLGRYEEAIATYQHAASAAPDSRWGRLAVFGEGWADYRAGHCDEGVKVLARYLAPSPRADAADHEAEALFAQGNCFLQLGNAQDALASFGQLLSRYPRHPMAFEAGLATAEVSRRQEQWLPANELLHKLLRWPLEAEANAQVQLRLGQVALDQGNDAQATTAFRAAAEASSPTIRQAALSGRGDVEVFLGHLPDARQFYQDAIALAPKTAVASYATYQLARIDLQRGATEQAITAFQQLAAQAEPPLADDARLALVIAYVAQHEDDLARSLVNDMRRSQPETPLAARAAYYQALLVLADGDDTQAQHLCTETLANAPRSDEALEARLLLAELQLHASSPRDVEASLQTAYRSGRLPRRHRAALAKRLGDLTRTDGAYADAIRWYEEAETLWPSFAGDATYRIASCYEEAGDIELAMGRYQLIEQPPWRVRGQLAAVRLLERANRTAEAEAILSRLANEPIPEAKAIQEQLAALRGQTTRSE